jgi:hypothetical protein
MKKADKFAAFSEGFKIICQADKSPLLFKHNISYIGTILTRPSFSQDYELLFVCNSYSGDSVAWDRWYKLDAHGTIKGYCLHNYAPESYDEPWN